MRSSRASLLMGVLLGAVFQFFCVGASLAATFYADQRGPGIQNFQIGFEDVNGDFKLSFDEIRSFSGFVIAREVPIIVVELVEIPSTLYLPRPPIGTFFPSSNWLFKTDTGQLIIEPIGTWTYFIHLAPVPLPRSLMLLIGGVMLLGIFAVQRRLVTSLRL